MELKIKNKTYTGQRIAGREWRPLETVTIPDSEIDALTREILENEQQRGEFEIEDSDGNPIDLSKMGVFQPIAPAISLNHRNPKKAMWVPMVGERFVTFTGAMGTPGETRGIDNFATFVIGYNFINPEGFIVVDVDDSYTLEHLVDTIKAGPGIGFSLPSPGVVQINCLVE